jgi:hypothetical protein
MRRRQKREPVTCPHPPLEPVPMRHGLFALIYLQTLSETVRIPDAGINLETQIG